jgi:hypothetical protein
VDDLRNKLENVRRPYFRLIASLVLPRCWIPEYFPEKEFFSMGFKIS